MILDFFQGPMDGDTWESLCDSCYRMRYQEFGYQKIPAIHGGDAGVEGYTGSGIVYQCYYPERSYTDDELYEHYRDKMTADISKLLSPDNVRRLVAYGVPPIKEWHFVIPEYRDGRILQHAHNKQQEVLEKKTRDKDTYINIDASFQIIIKIASDFTVELSKTIRHNLHDAKLNLAFRHTGEIDWLKCTSEKADNIRRKIKAIMGQEIPDDNEDYQDMVKYYIEAYIKGIELLERLRVCFPEICEEILILAASYKGEVSVKSKLNTNNTVNYDIFNKILNDFQTKIERDFNYLTSAAIAELKQDLIAEWLADCSLQFKG